MLPHVLLLYMVKARYEKERVGPWKLVGN